MTYISHYHADDTMSLLVCDNPQILQLLTRFGISLGFANKDIREVCMENDVHLETFLSVVNVALSGDKSEHIDYGSISVSSLVAYLRSTHTYFSNYRFPIIQQRLEEVLLLQKDNTVSILLNKYFEDYLEDVKSHLLYEEEVLFAYIDQLLQGKSDRGHTIKTFEMSHENTDQKLSELKDIMLKYFNVKSNDEIIEMLADIFRCSNELIMHSEIEERLLVPLVKYIENKGR